MDIPAWRAAEEKTSGERNKIRQALDDCEDEIRAVKEKVKQALDYENDEKSS